MNIASPRCSSLSEKRPLRVLCVLGASAVSWFFGEVHRKDAEYAEITQRKNNFSDRLLSRQPMLIQAH
jgi:hypothetical protein